MNIKLMSSVAQDKTEQCRCVRYMFEG